MKKALLLFSAFMAFITTSKAQLMNPGLETWRSVPVIVDPLANLEAPNFWFTADSLVYFGTTIFGGTAQKQVFKSTDSHSGAHAALLMTRDQDALGVLPGILANAEIIIDPNFDPNDPLTGISYSGGTEINQRVDEISAWVKYMPKGADQGWITAMAVMSGAGANGDDSVVGMGDLFVDQTTGYEEVTVPITYINTTDVPDKLIMAFMSSTIQGTATTTDSTIMLVDDVALTFVTDVNDVKTVEQVVSVYPNPSQGLLNLATKAGGNLKFEAYDLKGQQVAAQEFRSGTTVDLQALPSGLYLYKVMNDNGVVMQKGKFNIR